MADTHNGDGCDVIVVGGGGAGLMAALCARERGARVILCEKEPATGGKSSLAMGILTASETEFQRAAGIEDSHEAHIGDLRDYFAKTGAALDEEKLRLLIVESNETFRRLQELGVEIRGPNPEGPHNTPRLHNIVGGGRSATDPLREACISAGVTIETASPAREILRGRGGTITGVRAIRDGEEFEIRGNAVVLAAGDYAANPEMVEEVTGKALHADEFRAFATGDGYRMAVSVGAQRKPAPIPPAPHVRFVEPPHVEPTHDFYAAGPVLIGRSGRETTVQADPPEPLEEMFILFDSAVAGRLAEAADDVGPGRDGWKRTGKPYISTAPTVGYFYLEDCHQLPWFAAFDSAAEMAQHIGCRVSDLRASTASLDTPPLYVLGPLRRYMVEASAGGIAVSPRMEALDGNDLPIPGLYAAGTNAGWLHYFGGHGHPLGWAFASGRLAGQNAADWVRDSDPTRVPKGA